MSNPNQNRLIRQATEIFLRLRDDPDNLDLLREKDAFLRRGEAEKTAYKKVLSVWQATDTGKKPSSPKPLLIAGITMALAVGSYWGYQPLRILLVADLSTQTAPAKMQLVSGDKIILDAGSAVTDNSDDNVRHVTLLRGAAFFDVDRNGQTFVVSSGDLQIEVLGTSFEVDQRVNGSVVTVTKGAVRVSWDNMFWELSPGEQLVWDENAGARVRDIALEDIASWRENLLISDGLRLSQVVAALDRRLPGNIVIPNKELAALPIVGTFDLGDPKGSLHLLAELTDTRLFSLPFVTTFMPR